MRIFSCERCEFPVTYRGSEVMVTVDVFFGIGQVHRSTQFKLGGQRYVCEASSSSRPSYSEGYPKDFPIYD